MSQRPYQAGVFIGRFQPYHLGHAQMLARALESVQLCIVVLGSAFQPATPKNPFSWTWRAEMIRRSLKPDDAERVVFLPLRDYYDGDRWAEALRAGVGRTLAERGIVAGTDGFALISHYKDASSAYLRWFPQWETLAFPRQNSIDATPLRDALFAAIDGGTAANQAIDLLAGSIPAGTSSVLQVWAASDAPARLAAEWRSIVDYRNSWARAPYAPILVTVDIIVECNAQILVIERAGQPGKGSLALPGGFLDQDERIFAAALRELREETGLELTGDAAREWLVGVRVFDHPGRDPRGRAITHVHHFRLPHDTLPPVTGADDASVARWLSRNDIACEEGQFFGDHFHIIDRMCDVLRDE